MSTYYIVNNNVNMQLCEHATLRSNIETVSAFSYGAQVKSFKQKMVENLVTLSLLAYNVALSKYLVSNRISIFFPGK